MVDIDMADRTAFLRGAKSGDLADQSMSPTNEGPRPYWVVGIDDAHDRMNDLGDGQIILLLAHPITELARSLEGGLSMQQAVDQCMSYIRMVLNLRQSHHNRLLVVDHANASRYPAACVKEISTARDLHLPSLDDIPPPPEGKASYVAFATLAVHDQPELRRQVAEYEAGLLPLGSHVRIRPEWTGGFEQFRKIEEDAALFADFEALERKYNALQADFKTVAEVEGALARRNMDLFRELTMTETERDNHARALAQLQTKATNLEVQMAAVKANLAEARTRADVARRQAEESQARVGDLLQSTSWRITAPIRAIKTAIFRR